MLHRLREDAEKPVKEYPRVIVERRGTSGRWMVKTSDVAVKFFERKSDAMMFVREWNTAHNPFAGLENLAPYMVSGREF